MKYKLRMNKVEGQRLYKEALQWRETLQMM